MQQGFGIRTRISKILMAVMLFWVRILFQASLNVVSSMHKRSPLLREYQKEGQRI
jgi:hypothetical protein